MCEKCDPKRHYVYWIHIADHWSAKEKLEMFNHLSRIRRFLETGKSFEEKKLNENEKS